MKTQNKENKLAFKVATVTELTDTQMHDIKGDTTITCVMAFITSMGLGFQIGKGVYKK